MLIKNSDGFGCDSRVVVTKFQLPHGWKVAKLGELFDITSSKRVFKNEWQTQGVSFYRAREIVKLSKNGAINNELFITREMFNDYKKKYGVPKKNDIMVTGVGTLGVCYVVKDDDEFYFKDGNIIWLKNKGLVNPWFIEYAFQSPLLRGQIDDSAGATVGTYTIIKANNTIVFLPSLPEQTRIVAILDEAFANISQAVANAEKNLANAREFFENYLNEIFTSKGEGWINTTIETLCDSMEYGTSAKSQPEGIMALWEFPWKPPDVVLASCRLLP